MPTETIIQLLENGKWHKIQVIPKETKLNPSKVEQVTKFLEQYNFIKINKATQKIKLNKQMDEFLKKVRQIETQQNNQ